MTLKTFDMTQEEKELLIKDLCARLPYGVICHWSTGSELTLNLTENNGLLISINKVNIEGSNESYWDCYFDCNGSNGNSFQNEDIQIEIVKPYLRSMSSMTDEEREEWTDLFNSELDKLMSIEDEKQAEDLAPNYFASSHSASVDWLNKKMFDYRKLIPMGLALEAPENMYTKIE